MIGRPITKWQDVPGCNSFQQGVFDGRMTMQAIRWIVIAAVALRFAPASAQSVLEAEADLVDQLASLELEDLLEVVVVASGVEESVAIAPAAVTVIDRADIRARASRTIPDLLRTVPGVQVIQVAPGNYLVSLRGTGGLRGDNVLVTVDGIPVNSPVDGSIDWSVIPASPHTIERIEVARGPVSSIYGANAYTGVIRIETVFGASEDRSASTTAIGGGVDLDGRPVAEASIVEHGRRGDAQWSLRADGAMDSLFSEQLGLDRQAVRRLSLGARVQTAIGSRGVLSVAGAGSRSDGSAVDYLVMEHVPHATRAGYGRASLTFTDLGPVITSAGIWAHAQRYVRDADPAGFVGFHYDGTRASTATTGAEVGLGLPAEVDLAVGVEAGVVTVRAPYIHPDENDQARGTFGGRVSARIPLTSTLSLALAGRIDQSAFLNGLHPSGRGSITYFKDNLSARLTVGSAFRQPTYVELGGRFRDPRTGLILLEGEPDLGAPQVEAVEAAAIVLLGDRGTVRPTLYVARAKNLVEGDFDPIVRKTFRNNPDAPIFTGLELESEFRIAPGVYWELSGAGLLYLTEIDEAAARSVTLGRESHNSQIIAWTGARASLLDRRLHLGGYLGFASERSYNLRAGIPPRVLAPVTTKHHVRAEGAVEYQLLADAPLNLRLAAITHLPHGVRESPLPDVSRLGTQVMGFLVYRRD
jgi:outer membrane cobalamin receptor